MARVKKPDPTLEMLFFATPQQRVVKLLLAESTSVLNIRALSSMLKGVRGLGGAEGLLKILHELEQLAIVEFVDNNRSIRLHDDNAVVKHMKVLSSVCDLEGVFKLIKPMCERAILFGSRSTGQARTDSNYDLFVVTDQPSEVKHHVERHPLGRMIELTAWTSDDYSDIGTKDTKLDQKLERGIQLWGSAW